MDSGDAGRSGDAGLSGVAMTDGEASGRDGRRPGWAGLFWATVVVLVVGGFALSRSYGVQEVSSGTLPPVPPVPSTSTTSSSTVTIDGSNTVDPIDDDWMYQVTDVEVSPDGAVFVSAPVGLARLDGAGEWTLIDVEGLPAGTGLNDELFPVRYIKQVATGPDGLIWIGAFAMSHGDDEQFGGNLDRGGRRILWWVARLDGCWGPCSWTVFTSNEVPEFANGIGDLVVSPDGTVYASVGLDLLMMFDGDEWSSHEVPHPTGGGGVPYPWSISLAVGNDGLVWAGSNYDTGEVQVLRFDGTGFARYITDDGLASDNIVQVTSAGDGTIWAATERSGIARFDGTSWTSYTTADGLLSDDAVIAAGADGTVWAAHFHDPPYGYSRFDGTGWTTYPFYGLVGGWIATVGPDGTLWTVSEEALVSFDGDTRTVYPSPFVDPDGVFRFMPVQWGIILDDSGPGIHTVSMIVDARPLTLDNVERLSGRLIWVPFGETVVDLCGIEIRQEGNGFLHIGDIFQTSEGCGSNPTAMQDAFDEIGLPETACVTVTVGGVDHEYCAPLGVPRNISVGSEPGTVTVSLDGLEGFERLAVDAWVVPLEPTEEWQRLGGTSFWPINQDPVFASEVIHPQGESYFDFVDGEAATFEPGTYRFIIEAYVPSGNMRYGCEMPIQVVEGEPFVVVLSSIPTYSGDGIHWTPLDELEYPDCPGRPSH